MILLKSAFLQFNFLFYNSLIQRRDGFHDLVAELEVRRLPGAPYRSVSAWRNRRVVRPGCLESLQVRYPVIVGP